MISIVTIIIIVVAVVIVIVIAHLVLPLAPNPSPWVRIWGEAFGGFGGLGPLDGVFPLPSGLLAHLSCTSAIGAQWWPRLSE